MWNKARPIFCRLRTEPLGLSPPRSGLCAACFGAFALYLDGELVHISNKKAVELLALLLSEQGRALRKTYAAEVLWPESDPAHAMDNLYKVCGAIRGLKKRGIALPLESRRDTIWLDAAKLDSDVARFEQLYRLREEIACCEAAVALYTGPFLMNEYYEWTARAEAYYDMRYLELLSLGEAHFTAAGNRAAARYYRLLMDALA